MQNTYETARDAAIFRRVKTENIDKFLKKSSVRTLHRGASIYLQGERAHSLFIVIEGWIKTYRMTPCGNEAVVGIYTKSSSFGEEAALTDQSYMTGAEAVSDALVMQIDACFLANALSEDLELCQSVLSGSMDNHRSLVQHVEQLKSHTAGQRIADFLLTLCGDRTGNCTVILPYDKVLIAAWLGMKPESLSRAFRRLKASGVTIKKDRAIIDSVEQLATYADEDPAEAWSLRQCSKN